MTSPLRILLLEDDPTDAALIQGLLEAGNIVCEVTHAQTRAEYLSGLEDPAINVILADYRLPSFDGLSALKLAQSMRPGLPFIFVSGTLGEEVAIEALKIGATDYVLKGRLSRLALSVKRALSEADDRIQRKRAEEALRRSEMYLAEAQGLSRTGSWGWEVSTGDMYWSEETYRILEIEPTTRPTAQIVLERTHPDDLLYVRQLMERVALEGRSFSAEHRLRMPNGSVKHVRVVARPAENEDPARMSFIGAVTDITERKRTEEALNEINDRFRLLAESSLSGIYLIQEGLLRYVNPALARMFGHAVEDLVNRLGPRDLVHPEDRPLVLENIRRRIEGDMEEIRYECRGLRKDGSVFPVEVHGRRIEYGGRVAILGTLLDITDRRRAENELRASEQRFRDYSEIVSDWFWETGPDHRFSRVSGKPPDWAIAGKFVGSLRWELAADREDEPEKWRTHLAALDAHQPFRGFKYRITRPDGSSLYISVSGKPLFDADSKFLGYRGTAADVTAEVRAEQAERALRETQAELAHVTRVMTMGELSASIAHELTQPIGAVINDARAGLHWLDKPVPNLSEAREVLESIVKTANRATEVIQRIRGLTKKAPAVKTDLNINDVILEVTALTRAELHRNHVTLRTQLADELPPVQTDRIEFQQVLLNLIINAIEAMEKGVRRDLLIASRKAGSKVQVEVCDTGLGLAPGTADRIFQPFFTTKPGGMGMGLAICRTIVERLGGKLSARANTPCGTIFELSMPLEPHLS